MTNSISRLNKETYECLHTNHLEKTVYLEDLLSQGHAVPEEKDEFQCYLVARKEFIFSESDTIQYVIAPSMLCNLKCLYCFEKDRMRCSDNLNIMSPKVIENTIKFINQQLSKHGNIKKLKITWFGGEPLLQMETIKHISHCLINICTERNIDYSAFIITNGLLLNEEIIKELLKCKVNKLQITIDGDNRFYSLYKKTDITSLDKLIHNIELASQVISVDIRMNTSKENSETVIKVAKELMRNSAISNSMKVYAARIEDCIHPSCTSMSEMEFEIFREKFEAELKSYRSINGSLKLSRRLAFCSTVKKDYCVIDASGNLYRCEHEVGNHNEIIGDVVNGFYRNAADIKFLDMEVDNDCKTCSFLPICAGGCPSKRLIYGQKLDCNSVKKKILYQIQKELLN